MKLFEEICTLGGLMLLAAIYIWLVTKLAGATLALCLIAIIGLAVWDGIKT